jgi:formamidopyrimidine-DNA glycosylase
MDAELVESSWRRARSCCEYCHLSQEHSLLAFEIDHIIAKKHGGRTVAKNLALACYYCNSFKGPNIGGLDPYTGKLTQLFNPRRHLLEAVFSLAWPSFGRTDAHWSRYDRGTVPEQPRGGHPKASAYRRRRFSVHINVVIAMPELPDIVVYLECLKPRIQGQRLERVRLANPFLLRSVEPPMSAAHGLTVVGLRRLGKRIVIALESELFLVLHLMIAGRLQWKKPGAKPPGKVGLAAFDFPTGTLILTEAGSKRRASLHLVRGEIELARHNTGGLEVLDVDELQFRAALLRENHTLKRALTDPRLFSGIGNAYSDEILHRARLSPLALTHRLKADEITRLFQATQTTLLDWLNRLRRNVGGGFPEKVTAFRPDMAVHGRFGQPCPVCSAPVQRIVYAENETNYCPRCQTDGKVLADRSLSRLLKDDWPRSIEELEEGKGAMS